MGAFSVQKGLGDDTCKDITLPTFFLFLISYFSTEHSNIIHISIFLFYSKLFKCT